MRERRANGPGMIQFQNFFSTLFDADYGPEEEGCPGGGEEGPVLASESPWLAAVVGGSGSIPGGRGCGPKPSFRSGLASGRPVGENPFCS